MNRQPFLSSLDEDAETTTFSIDPLWRRKYRVRVWRFVFSFGPLVRNTEAERRTDA